MEYSVFNDVVMESTEYAMEGFNIKDGWKKFIEFCKKIIAKCKEILRKIVEKFKKRLDANKKETSEEYVISEEFRGIPRAVGAQYIQKVDNYEKMNVEFIDRRMDMLDKMMDEDVAKSLVRYMQKLNRQEFSRDRDADLLNKIQKYNESFENLDQKYSVYTEKRQSELDAQGDTLDQDAEDLNDLYQSYPAGTKRNIFYTATELNKKVIVVTYSIFNNKLKELKTMIDRFDRIIQVLNQIDNETNLDTMDEEFRTARKNIRLSFIRMNTIVVDANNVVETMAEKF